MRATAVSPNTWPLNRKWRTTVKLSCALAPSLDTPEHIVLAEKLGYHRAWCFDSPALYADVWMTLARTADRTETIGLGPAVLVPSLRHVMTSAAATATLAALAPGRVSVVIGSGFSGRLLLGEKAMRWTEVAEYAHALRNLLAGREVHWQGRLLKMLQDSTCAMPAHCEVPLLIAADGPKGFAVAQDIGHGLMSTGSPRQKVPDTPWRAAAVFGTVVASGTPHAGSQAAQLTSAMLYHVTYARAADAVDRFPGGQRWRESVEQVPPESRHLAVNDGHMVALNRHDQLIEDELESFSSPVALVGTPSQWRERCRAYEEVGVSEIVFQAVGADIPRELSEFASAAASWTS